MSVPKSNAAAFVAPPKNADLKTITASVFVQGEFDGASKLALPNSMSYVAHGAVTGAIKSEADVKSVYVNGYLEGKKSRMKGGYVAPNGDTIGKQVEKLALPFVMIGKFSSPAAGLAEWQRLYTYCVGTPDGDEKGAGGRILRNLQDMARKAKIEERALTKEEMEEIVSKNRGSGSATKSLRKVLTSIAAQLENIADGKKPYDKFKISSEGKGAMDKARRVIKDYVDTLPVDKKK